MINRQYEFYPYPGDICNACASVLVVGYRLTVYGVGRNS